MWCPGISWFYLVSIRSARFLLSWESSSGSRGGALTRGFLRRDAAEGLGSMTSFPFSIVAMAFSPGLRPTFFLISFVV